MTRMIKVSDTTHEKLGLIKKVNRSPSFDGAIHHMIEGCVDDLNVIKRKQTALTLEFEGYGNIDEETKNYEIFDSTELKITFRELRGAEIGDTYTPDVLNYTHCYYEMATVVYTEKDFVALKINSFLDLPWKSEEDVELLGVYLL